MTGRRHSEGKARARQEAFQGGLEEAGKEAMRERMTEESKNSKRREFIASYK